MIRQFFRLSGTRLIVPLTIGLFAVTHICVAQAPPAEGRPVLFVHGWCSSANDWTEITAAGTPLGITIANYLHGQSGSLYSDPAIYTVYYDAPTSTVRLWPSGTALLGGSINSTARFFAINLADPTALSNPSNFQLSDVAQVSIFNKGAEIAEVIHAITALTLIKDVIIVSHSMGGLDARAYIENLSIPWSNLCTDADNYTSCDPAIGTLKYTQDVNDLITIDAPNGGALSEEFISVDQSELQSWGLPYSASACLGNSNLNRRELLSGSNVVETLQVAAPWMPASITIASITDFTDPGLLYWDLRDDGVVSDQEQSFGSSLEQNGFAIPPSNLHEYDNSFSLFTELSCLSAYGDLLHQLPCLGAQAPTVQSVETELQGVLDGPAAQPTAITVQATLDGNPWPGAVNYTIQGYSTGYKISGSIVPNTQYLVPLDVYSVTSVSGGPSTNVQFAPTSQFLGINETTGQNSWSLTGASAFTLEFTSNGSSPPIPATESASNIATDGATLNGTINPDGTATTAWFEWSTNSTLQTYQSAPAQFIGAETGNVAMSFEQTGLEPNTTYYYELFASNGNGVTPGGIQPFTTLSPLPSPAPYAPANQATNVATPPLFSWSAVGNATSYRLIVATTTTGLPSDPSDPTCGVGCVLNTTPSGPAYVPPLILAPATTYYWEVHARGTLQDGNWSAVYSFTTAPPSVSSVVIAPSTVPSGASTTLTVALSGPAPGAGIEVTLSSSSSNAFPVPNTVTVPPGSTTGTVTVQAGTVSTSTTATVSAAYNSSTSSSTVTVTTNGGSGVVIDSLVISPSSIVGGYAPLGIVTLTGAAPPNTAVSLQSNNSQFAQVPKTATVTQGYTSVAFPITTFFTGGSTGATITASYNNTTYAASVTVLPLAISGVAFYPPTVTGGSAAPFTIYLDGPAPAGASIALVSSNPSVLQVPPSVPVATGATSVSITGTTSAPMSQTSVIATATYNGSSSQGSLAVAPAPTVQLEAISMVPETITGGTEASGTVYLTAIAPSGGVNVALTSSSGLVQAPATVLVPSGAWYAPFTASTSSVSAVTNVTLTANFGGASQPATLTLVPPLPYLASLAFNPSTANGGSQIVGTITLTAPAPDSGAGINLTNSLPYVVNVPPVVVVPSGNTSVNFNISTLVVNFITPALITASYNGTQHQAQIFVVPPGTPVAPGLITLSPLSTVGGTNSLATVLLTGPAPSPGASLAVSSDNPAVQVPPSVNVPVGASAASFIIGTNQVSVISTATISVNYNGINQSTLLTLEPSGTPPPNNPVPLLVSPLMPISIVPGTTNLSLTVDGTGFVPGAQVLWNGADLETTFVNGAQLQAAVPSTDVQTNSTAMVTVSNPGAAVTTSNVSAEHVTYPVSSPRFNEFSVATAGAPLSLATGDFNKDGQPDLLVLGYGLSVMLGNSNGTFGPERFVSGNGVTSVAVTDLNEDGKSDIAAVVNVLPNPLLDVFLGNGDGTFTALPSITLPPASLSTISIMAADFNGDGFMDLAITAPQGVWILLGHGDGTFGIPTPFGSISGPLSLVSADFNGDGKLDLALSDSPNQSVAILLGNGDGTFQSQQEFSTNGYAQSIAVADFNRDGHPDLAVANEGPIGSTGAGVAVLLGKGDGSFSPPVIYGAGANYEFVTTDDLNGDGNLDILIVPTPQIASTELLFLGNGDGTFSSTPVPVGSSPNSQPLIISDVNRDGASDMLIPIYSGNSVSVFLQSISPILQVTPSSLAFTVSQGSDGGEPLSLTMTNTGGGAVSWTATANQSWIVLGQTSGTAPSTFSVSVNATGLNPGTYVGTITIMAAGASNSPQTIDLTLTVNAAQVVVGSLSFSPATITGAGSSSGTVTLTGPAPIGGATVGLSSNNSLVQVPPTIAIAVGSALGTFNASASGVATQTIVTVTASDNGVSATGTLTLNPPGPLTVSPTSLSFGNQGIGSTSVEQNVTLTNNSGATLTISSTALGGRNATDFAQSASTCGNTLSQSASCTISLAFTPSAAGARSAKLTITDNASNSPQVISLAGTGVQQVTLSATTLAFDNQADGSKSAPKAVMVTNNTSTSLSISSINIAGQNSTEFVISSNTCGSSLLGHSTCKVAITFEPLTTGSKTATLTITDSATNSPQDVSLMGTGIIPVSVTPLSLTFTAQKVGTTSPAQSVSLTNNLPSSLKLTPATFTGSNAHDFAQSSTTCGSTLGAGATCTISVTFTPSAKGKRVATLNIHDNAITNPQRVNLTGTGE